MKKNRIYIIIFVLMAGIAGYFLYTSSNSTIRVELRDFAITDTTAVDKIFMADRQGRTILLERKGVTEWSVNGKFRARQDMISNLLYTMTALEVRSPVGKNLYNQTMKLMSSNSTKVEIYSKEQLLKTYYVGHPTMDNLGTFMYLEGSSVPFIMNIPGFNGFLTTRYSTIENEWKSKLVFDFNPRSITEISVVNPAQPDSSFTLKIASDSSYSILRNNGSSVSSIDIAKVSAYLTIYKGIYYEVVFDGITAELQDSLNKIGPFNTISVALAGGLEKQVSLYRKKFTGSTMAPDDEGVAHPFDPDRFYLSIKGDKNWYICQYYQWNKLLKTPGYFIPPAGAK